MSLAILVRCDGGRGKKGYQVRDNTVKREIGRQIKKNGRL